ncbi:kinase-like protein [Thelephora ganbajun]|uniref:Kinase-like protein n=1 Tax=Thelephora ganbajun TaxID=370292 RepID=A0ACB6ZHK1_THEGA|nr:kinase-like protein [Thelephora ganbajun]
MPGLTLWTRKRYLKLLYRTCGHHKLVPATLKIPICYDRTSHALYKGGFADVWKGEHRGRDVAVKVIRMYSTSDLKKVVGRFCKEVVTWKFLRHPNVLPLLGVTMSEAQFAMIPDWMTNGNINDFVKAYPDVDRLGLLVGVAEGLIYIHGQEMIHGDLKGANILIDQTSNARLADFGLLTIISDPANFLSSSSYTQGGTARWMSPELIDPQRFGFKKNRPTRSSDRYALEMVIYETISGDLPFHEHADLTVFMKVMEGKHPTRGVRFPESLWKMVELCWSSHPKNRPSIGDVLRCLEMVSNTSEPPSIGVDEEMEENDDDWDSANGHLFVHNGMSGVESLDLSNPASSHSIVSITSPPSYIDASNEVNVNSLCREET